MGDIRFDDGAAYERMMGTWSRLAGDVFLDWLAPPPRLRWLDIGCGNGAFTHLVVERCDALEVHGIDPSAAQIAYARRRTAATAATYHRGDALALPFRNAHFDAAVMALVIVFVNDPARGVAEMTRVVRPGGLVAAYVWDMVGGGFPLDPVLEEMRAMGLVPPVPPRVGDSTLQTLQLLWADAGLERVTTREISVRRRFASFDDYWATTLSSSTLAPMVAGLDRMGMAELRKRVHERLGTSNGPIACEARAHAVRGIVRKSAQPHGGGARSNPHETRSSHSR